MVERLKDMMEDAKEMDVKQAISECITTLNK